MSRKVQKVRNLIQGVNCAGADPRYAGFFHCFNRRQFFEAHEVLEDLWLEDRHGPNGAYYKGLIQLAGAFVHIQKGRPGPAAALFRLARANLALYPRRHQALDLAALLAQIDFWTERVCNHGCAALHSENPVLHLLLDTQPSEDR